jgi:hypothetical protein
VVSVTDGGDRGVASFDATPVIGRNVHSALESTGWMASLGLPPGVIERVLESCDEFSERIWIIDNSGSMSTSDGHRLAQDAKDRDCMVACSRWEELADSLRFHAQLAAKLRAPTQFRALNPPCGGAPQVVRVGYPDGDEAAEIESMEALLRSGPRGRTPLCEALSAIVSSKRREGGRHRFVLIVASDGASTDGKVGPVMAPLRELSCWTVVRLCTDDSSVVEYWNAVDEELELDMDVLDDLAGEAAEVAAAGNAWLNYGLPLHRLREWGTSRKIIDILDERALTLSEVREFVALLLGAALAGELPHPQLEGVGAFNEALRAALESTQIVYNPVARRRAPWIDLASIARAGRREMLANNAVALTCGGSARSSCAIC